MANNPPLCACGCKNYVTWNKGKKCWNIYITGHNSRDGFFIFHLEYLKPPPLCACDCNNPVTWNKDKKCWNIYIKGHYSKEIRKRKKGNIPWNKGLTKETDERIAKQAKGREGHIVTEETRDLIKIKNKLISLENWKDENYRNKIKEAKNKPEVREKTSRIHKDLWKNPEYRERMLKLLEPTWSDPERNRKVAEGNTGEKSHAWRGGISKEPYSQNWTETLKESIRQRDNYQCQICGISQEEARKKFHKGLYIHHIDYDKENCDPNNLISLCNSCHSKTSIKDRNRWINFFINLQQRKEII